MPDDPWMNLLTDDGVTDMGYGATFYECRVEVEAAEVRSGVGRASPWTWHAAWGAEPASWLAEWRTDCRPGIQLAAGPAAESVARPGAGPPITSPWPAITARILPASTGCPSGALKKRV